MPEVNLTDWNRFLESHPNAHLLQMGEWGELKKDFGWKPVRIVLNNEVGCQILFRRLPLGLTLGYMPKPVFSCQWAVTSEQFWKEVDSICKKNHAVFLKIEPDTWADEFQLSSLPTFKLSPHNIQPPRTIVVDIKDSEETILARMKPKCRYNIRLAEKKGVTVRAWDNIPAFHEMMTVTGGRDNFGVHSKEYYQRAYGLFHPKGTCELLVAEYEGKPLASLMVFANANAPGMSTAHPTTSNATECQLIFCSGKLSAGQKRAAVRNMTCGASLMKTKKLLKLILNPATMDFGASTASSAALAVNLNAPHKHWIEFIVHCCIGRM